MPTEQEMLPKDKYTVFDRKEKKYRKGIHSEIDICRIDGGEKLMCIAEVPKWTRVSQRLNPPGF